MQYAFILIIRIVAWVTIRREWHENDDDRTRYTSRFRLSLVVEATKILLREKYNYAENIYRFKKLPFCMHETFTDHPFFE